MSRFQVYPRKENMHEPPRKMLRKRRRKKRRRERGPSLPYIITYNIIIL